MCLVYLELIVLVALSHDSPDFFTKHYTVSKCQLSLRNVRKEGEKV